MAERRGPGPADRAAGAAAVLIITGDGLNCERETAWAFRLAGAQPQLVHISDVLRRERRLQEFSILAFIGGFSNGDHLGAGTVQASRFRHGLREDLEGFIDRGGLIIGICNGFQTLVKMGVLPGGADTAVSAMSAGGADSAGSSGRQSWERTATIMANDSGRFEDRWVHLAVNPGGPCVWTRGLRRLFLPVRHGEGKFVVREPGILGELARGGQVVARYATAAGQPTLEYPANPNGSQEAVAGICDPTGRIFGLMPHPEAYLLPYHHPSWTREAALGRPLPEEGEGLAVFRNAVQYLAGTAR
jgi:phosphoribosylformylglycinamidine synthase I